MALFSNPPLADVLAREHAAARTQRLARRTGPGSPDAGRADFRTSQRYRESYLAIDPVQGRWLAGIVLATGARTIVEFGSSFGISTLYLAAAANRTGGQVIGTEYHPEKAERARATLADAGLVAEIRVGDARETLAAGPEGIDLLFLDGAKDMYLPMLHMLEPRLRPGAVVVADNVPLDPEVENDFVAAITDPGSGYVTALMSVGKGGMSHSVKL